MKRLVQLSVGLVVIMMIASHTLAASSPVITGIASGLELCFQFLCGSAIFGGGVQLQVDGKPRKGSFLVSVTHQSPLPDEIGETVLILGGDWVITTKKDVFSGHVTSGDVTSGIGTITRLAGNNFAVNAELALANGGTGTIYFSGTLSHEQFPFTIVGVISQTP
jgi:hypothetical protein